MAAHGKLLCKLQKPEVQLFGGLYLIWKVMVPGMQKHVSVVNTPKEAYCGSKL